MDIAIHKILQPAPLSACCADQPKCKLQCHAWKMQLQHFIEQRQTVNNL